MRNSVRGPAAVDADADPALALPENALTAGHRRRPGLFRSPQPITGTPRPGWGRAPLAVGQVLTSQAPSRLASASPVPRSLVAAGRGRRRSPRRHAGAGASGTTVSPGRFDRGPSASVISSMVRLASRIGTPSSLPSMVAEGHVLVGELE